MDILQILLLAPAFTIGADSAAPGPFRSEAGQAYTPGSEAGQGYTAGSEGGQAEC